MKFPPQILESFEVKEYFQNIQKFVADTNTFFGDEISASYNALDENYNLYLKNLTTQIDSLIDNSSKNNFQNCHSFIKKPLFFILNFEIPK